MTTVAHIPGGDTKAPVPVVTQRASKVPYLLLLPGVAWLLIFFAAPMVFLASQSLQTGSLEAGYRLTWSIGTYGDAISAFHSQLIRSFVYAGTATVLGLLIGYPLAYAIAFKSGRWKNILLVLVIAPFFTSFLIRTLAWQTILSSNGPVVGFFRTTHLMDLLRSLHFVVGNDLLSTTYNFLPFMVLPLYASLERIDIRLLEAGGDLYARPFTAFRKVTWPLSLPGVVAGTLLTFIPAAGDYINSKLLGNTSTTMVGQVIDGQFLRVLDYPTAAALSFTLMLTILFIVAIYVRRAGTEELV
jgi:spermidine/putrescine transport system permease protein